MKIYDVKIVEREKTTMGRDMENAYKWLKNNIRRYSFTINKETDKDVYKFFEKKENKREYLMNLIKEDMAKNKKQ